MHSASRSQLSLPATFLPRLLEVGRTRAERIVFALFIASLPWGTALGALSGQRLVFFGKNFCGYIWVVQGTLAGLTLALCGARQVVFPILLWLPWLAWVTIRCDWTNFGTAQRTIMLWAAPIAGAAASAVIVTERQLRWVLRTFPVIVAFSATIFLLHRLRALPAGIGYLGCGNVMTLCLAAGFAAPYVYQRRWRYVVLWSVCAAVCAFSGGRTATAVCLLTLPLCPIPSSMHKRVGFALLCLALSLLAFNSPAVRRKMTYSGEASATEVLRNPDDLDTSGRSGMWPLYLEEAAKTPLFGAGANAASDFGQRILGEGRWTHPHSEYIRVFFDYGLLGGLLIGVAIIATLVYTYRNIRRTRSRVLRDAWTVAFSGLVSMCLLAITDNVILYVAFFGCLLFGILGAAHGVAARNSRPFLPGNPLHGTWRNG